MKGQAEISFEQKSGVLYLNRGKRVRQVLVPAPLRHQIIDVAYGSIMRGHMGIKKTAEKIQAAFYWPGIQGDVTRYCKSCHFKRPYQRDQSF